MSEPPRLLFLVTEDWYFCSHRLPLAIAARDAGFDVSVATRVGSHEEAIRQAGIEVIPLRWTRRGRNPLTEMRAVLEIARVYSKWRPDIVHHVAAKPMIYGSIAAALSSVPYSVNAIAGMGYVFSSTNTSARLLKPLVTHVYRTLLSRNNSTLIVQNGDDFNFALSQKFAHRGHLALIEGSGVDTNIYFPTPEPMGRPVVILPARMLRDKGVAEFAEAARIVKKQINARFCLVGDIDADNPASFTERELRAYVAEGAVEWWGWRNDMNAVFAQSNIVCLPSYREGIPKALIDAAACGRAIVSTNVPGCKDVVTHGKNGLLVAPRNAVALAEAITQLLENPAMRQRMGKKGRAIVEQRFSIDRVIAQTLAIYQHALSATQTRL